MIFRTNFKTRRLWAVYPKSWSCSLCLSNLLISATKVWSCAEPCRKQALPQHIFLPLLPLWGYSWYKHGLKKTSTKYSQTTNVNKLRLFVLVYTLDNKSKLKSPFWFSGLISKPEDFEQFIQKVEAGPYVCQICSYQQAKFGVVKNHIESKHFPDTFSYSCPFCDAVLGTNTALKIHKQRHHK